MIYVVYQQGCEMERKTSEASAIQYAQTLTGDVQVVAVEASGTYRSRTQIWPTTGTTRSN